MRNMTVVIHCGAMYVLSRDYFAEKIKNII